MNNELKNKDEKAKQLLEAYRRGDTTAFTPIYDMYVQMMLNYGRCLTTNSELIRDCVHDVFVKLLDPASTVRMKSVSSYLIISLRNRLVDEFRHSNHTVDKPAEEVAAKRYSNDVEQDYLDSEHDRLVHDRVTVLMGTLTPRQRRVFQLYYIEQRRYDEICSIMQMNYHSVRNLVHRGMLRLRAEAV